MLGTEAIWACLHLDDPPPRDWCHRVAVVIFAANVPASLLALHYRSQVIRRIRMPPDTQALSIPLSRGNRWIEVLLPLEQGNDHGRNREISQANGDHNGDPVGRPAC